MPIQPQTALTSLRGGPEQPTNETSVELHDRLDGHYTTVYGRHRYDHVSGPSVGDGGPRYDRAVSIIGIRGDDGWKVYAQKLDTGHAMSIRSVHEI